MSVVIFNNTFDENALPLSNITLRRAKYIDQSRAGGISAITGSCIEIHRHFVYFVIRIRGVHPDPNPTRTRPESRVRSG